MNARPSTSRVTRLLAILAANVCAWRAATPAGAAPASTAPVAAVIDASRTSAPINPNLYGMFIEHAGSLVYRGMWAEIIDDRKFWNPITVETAEPPAARRRGPFGGPPRRWTPIGPAEFVTMDAVHAYVGDHSPAIALVSSQPRGIRQKGLTLLRDKSYSGRIVLAGDPGAQVSVSLAWGTGSGDRADDHHRKADDRLRHVPARLPVPGRERGRPARDHGDWPRHPARRRGVADARRQRRRLAARGHRRPEVAALGRLPLAWRQLRLRSRLARRDRRSRTSARPSGTPSGAPCSPMTSAPTSSWPCAA